MRRVVLAAALLLALLPALPPPAAHGFWTPESQPGGAGRAAMSTVPAMPAPTLIAVGGLVTLTWGAVALPGAGPATGYEVRRRNAVTGVSQPVAGTCLGLLVLLTCVDVAPRGRWRYSVVARVGTSWVGPEGALSTEVVVPL